MTNEPTLVVMAAGMGSRFGGLKQLMPVDDAGHPILDFSIYDAYRAGFRRAVFIIKRALEADFRAAVGDRIAKTMRVDYVFQELDDLPEGFAVPTGREKPWGTGHAVACCRAAVDGPFAVINADDFYGAGAFGAAYDFLTAPRRAGESAMVGYRLRNTVTENGSVSRGICTVENGLLTAVTERTQIEQRGDAAVYIENGAEHPLTGDETVSMNFFAFGPEMLDELWTRFPAFLERNLPENPLKCEYYLPSVVTAVLNERRGSVRVLECDEVWHGVTYRADLPAVKSAIAELKRAGVYPEDF